MSQADKTLILVVHGTNDSKEAPAGESPKWWQPESGFAERLRARLAEKRTAAEVLPFIWSGDNSALEREKAAIKLVKAVRAHATTYSDIHVIGHSHGGNVADHAAEILGWGLRNRKQLIASITSVGTPFLRTRFGNAETFGAIAFLAITIASFATLSVVTFLSYKERTQQGAIEIGAMVAVALIYLASAAAFLFALPLALQGIRRISRYREARRTSKALLAIWHPNDEAIAVLQRVEAAKITPFTPGALIRGSRTAAILWSVRLVLTIVALSLLTAGASALVQLLANNGIVSNEVAALALDGRGTLTLLGIGVGGALIAFSILYLAFRLLFGVVPELLLRGRLNQSVAGIIRGMALGKDGDQPVGEVSQISHAHRTKQIKLEGELAERLKSNASQAASRLVEHYRWALLQVADQNSKVIEEMAQDAMTWDSLIHTTYFDHDEVADMIASHIAAPARP